MAPLISEKLAWDIALTWREALQSQHVGENRVTLVTDRVGVASRIVKSYQWIKLDFRTSQDAVCGHGSVVAWYWLSCCAGYAGHENPQFWKRVFCELRRPAVTAGSATDTSCPSPITDAIRFFDVPENEFPRVQFDYANAALRVPHDVARGRALRSFFQSPSASSSDTIATLQSIFHQLRPYLIPARMQRAIPVNLHQQDFNVIQSLLQTQPPSCVATLPHLELMASPRCHDQWTPEISSSRVRRLAPNYFHSLFTSAPADTTASSYSRLQLERDRLGPDLLERVCSVVPLSKTIHSLNFKTRTHRTRFDSRASRSIDEPIANPEFSRMDWAWIGYALFHPDNKESSMRDLKIGLHGINREAIEILQLMRTGNNLYNVLSRSKKTNANYYHTAIIRAGSVARRTPTNNGVVVLEARDELQVCLCVDDVAQLPPWVCVVVPGMGLAWIRSEEIVSVQSRPSSSSHLESLKVEISSSSESSAALAFVKLVGRRLKHLDISACAKVRSSTLRRMLEGCPRLTSLCVRHDGSIWASSETDRLPQLRELCLHLETETFHAPSASALQNSLQSLEVLRIVSDCPCFDRNQSIVKDLLTMQPSIHYFHWSTMGEENLMTYTEGIAQTREVLGKLMTRTTHAMEQLAFLSVIRAKHDSAVASLDSDVIRQVFAFAKMRTPRSVWVEK